MRQESTAALNERVGEVVRLINGLIAYLDRQLRTANRELRTK